MDRLAPLRQVTPRTIPTIGCLAYLFVLGVVNGVAFYAVIRAACPEANVPLVGALAANAVAWLVGLLAVTSAGLVVREAALAFQLSLWMPLGDAIIVAVLWRAVQVAVELNPASRNEQGDLVP